MSRSPVPVADEICFENRMTPVFFFCRRRRGADEPARLRGAGLRLGAETQEKSRDVFLRAGERQAPARHQIEDFRFTRNLDDHSTKRCTRKRIGRRTHGIFRTRGAKKKNARRVEAELHKTWCGKFAKFKR